MNKKFEKGSEEWMMFTDFYNLCQKFYIPEHNNSYWNNLLEDTQNFYDKYKTIKLSEYLSTALLKYCENKIGKDEQNEAPK